MDWPDLLNKPPRWVIGLLAPVALVVVIYSITFARCPKDLFGLGFGPDILCHGDSSPDEIAQLKAAVATITSRTAALEITDRGIGATTCEPPAAHRSWRATQTV